MRILLILLSILLLTDCASYDFARRIRHQGTLLPQEKIERLRVGMTRDDVAILMGTSLISPGFNTDRWDYAYTCRKGNGPLEVQTVTLCFRGNVLVHIEHQPE